MSFDPYAANGGTVLAIAGKDYCVIAGDTRQSDGYTIESRDMPKVFRLTDSACIAVNGFAADGLQVVQLIKEELEEYREENGKEMTIKSIASVIQKILYSRRMFPYYTWVVLGGVEADGSGSVYGYDPVGSYERESCRAAGAAQSLLQPLLDNQVYFRNQANNTEKPGNLPLNSVTEIVTDVFNGAADRHIQVGDSLDIFIVTAPKRPLPELQSITSAKRIGVPDDSRCQMHVVRKELKKD